ncbi:MAG: 16S rRNA processing protein RimM [Alphaproteobacteria bacterium]|nr:16S rRNA processing protein RimM [Alphaproteobacteria bacterium]NCQ66726.1 16S rRNA processing protein RimM [Alphaproteobacteria bacterium]NCT07177.1 16S rRNA processing protein RimM [Alphaproteobacteria bacterium]
MVDSKPHLKIVSNPASQGAEQRVCLGVIMAPHGIQGEVKLKSFTQDPKNVGAYGPLFLDNGEDKLTLLKLRSPKVVSRETVFVARFKEVEDRETAQRLTGQKLYVLKDKLPKLAEPNDFYFEDLIGLKILSTDKRKEIGRVLAVFDFGAGEILELELKGYKESVMLPFLKEWVVEINVEAGFLILDATYLAEYLKPFKPSDEKWDDKAERKSKNPDETEDHNK